MKEVDPPLELPEWARLSLAWIGGTCAVLSVVWIFWVHGIGIGAAINAARAHIDAVDGPVWFAREECIELIAGDDVEQMRRERRRAA